jgi:hypothetical protein
MRLRNNHVTKIGIYRKDVALSCFEKVLQLRNRAQLCFVQVDHHFWMINLLGILSTAGAALGSFPGGNTRAVQAHTALDKA